MIEFNEICKETPYLIFKDLYTKSIKANQKNIEAIVISSYSKEKNEVNSRCVNIKFINDKNFIFFSNYNSPKSNDFLSHNQISGLFYWNSINVQIRIKANIERTSEDFNQDYFIQRDLKKNALAISSNQSRIIDSYEDVKKKYEKSIKKDNLTICPEYWGGFCFIPYYFEFWKGHNSRINKREVYELFKGKWVKKYLQP